MLACHFARRMAYELGREKAPEFSPAAVKLLENNRWEGNIRELKNTVERAVYRSDSDVIDAIAPDPFRSPYGTGSSPADTAPVIEPPAAMAVPVANQSLKAAVRNLERDMLKRALDASKYNRKKAAGLLGLTYDQLRGLLRKYKTEL